MSPRVTVRAAGVLPHRVKRGSLQVALVHRPRYDDWSWAKGKLERGEDWAAAAAREALEETGLRVRLGQPLPDAHYRVGSNGRLKRVRYWAATVVGGDGDLEHEIDEVVWLEPDAAAQRLTYDHDREQLDALTALHAKGRLDTWPLLVIRHSHAEPRGSWKGPDPKRPLTVKGKEWSEHLVGLIDAYEPVTLLSSPSTRCYDTVAPWARSRNLEPTTKKGLSEEGFEADPSKLTKHLDRVFAAAEPTAICTHGPLLGPLVTQLRKRAGKQLDSGGRQMLSLLAKSIPEKGEVLALTMGGQGDSARVVAAERHRPPS